MFKLVEHTGDIGIEVKAKTLKEFFEDCAKALYSIFIDISDLKPHINKTIEVQGIDEEEVVVEFLNELIYLFEVEKLILCSIEKIELTQNKEVKLKVKANFDIFDKKRHKVLGAGVKAVTYHDARIKISPTYSYAYLIVDV